MIKERWNNNQNNAVFCLVIGIEMIITIRIDNDNTIINTIYILELVV